MRRYGAIAVGILIALTACSSRTGGQAKANDSSTQVDIAPTSKDPSMPERQRRFDEWMAAASMVVNQTGDQTAEDMLEKVKATAAIGIPVGTSVRVDAGKMSDLLVVIPLIPADASTDRLFAQIESGNPATYYMSPIAIVLGDPEIFSLVWRGLAMISVMRQAFGPEQGSDVDNKRSDIEYILGLAAKMSPEFRAAVADELVRLGSEFDANEKVVSTTAPYPSSLDQAFGPPASEQERKLRAAEVWNGAVFGLLQERYGADANAKKNEFLIRAAAGSLSKPHS